MLADSINVPAAEGTDAPSAFNFLFRDRAAAIKLLGFNPFIYGDPSIEGEKD
jgi:hypothetical protein